MTETTAGYTTLRAANMARQLEWDQDAKITLSYRLNELAGETGEACNVGKKIERERLGIRGSRDTIEHLAEELADVVICADLVALGEGIDLDAAVIAKFNATSKKVGLSARLASQPPTRSPAELQAVAKVAAERAGKNANVAPQLLFAHIMWAMQDAGLAAPAQPDRGGWIVGNAADDHWRTWVNGCSDWTSDRDLATRYHRREDAELVHREDEDAWRVMPYGKPVSGDVSSLHPATSDLIDRFTAGLKEKLAKAEVKYGYGDGWLDADWQGDLVAKLVEHVQKGDPRDVAAYCAFAWHHGWSITPTDSGDAGARRDAVTKWAAELNGQFATRAVCLISDSDIQALIERIAALSKLNARAEGHPRP